METKKIQKFYKFNKKQRDSAFVWLMLAPSIVTWLIFYFYVNIDAFTLAFRVPFGGEIRWGFDNFTRMIEDFANASGDLGVALQNTFLYFFAGQFISFPISFALSFFMYKKIAGFRVFRVIFYLPSIIASTVLVILFKYLINDMSGPIAPIYEGITGERFPALLYSSTTATPTILFYTITFGLGGSLVMHSGAMSAIDPGLIEAAHIDGAGMWTEAIRIVVPMMWPTLSVQILFNVIGIFGSSGPVMAFLPGAEYDTYTLNYWLYRQVQYYGSYYYSSAVGMSMTFVSLPLVLFVRWLLDRGFTDNTQ